MATEGATEANTGLTEPEVEALEDAETKIDTELVETTVEVLEDEEEHTRMIDLETTPEEPTTATMTESAPPEERVHVLWNRARKRTQVRSLSAAQRIGYWLGGLSQGQLALVLGGLSQGQLALVLGGVAATALFLMALLSPLVRHPFWASLSLGTLLLALLLPSFQRSPVVTGVYVVAVFFGFLEH